MPPRSLSPPRFSEGDRVSIRLSGTVELVAAIRADGPRYLVALDLTPADILAGRTAPHVVECGQRDLRRIPTASGRAPR